MSGHEDTGPATFARAFFAQTRDLAVFVDLVVFQYGQLDLLLLMLVLLGSRVRLLLALLSATAKSQNQMQRRLFLDIVVGQRATVFQLLSGENQSLLIWRNSFLVLDLRLDIFDGIARLDLERDRFPSQSFHENLHFEPT